MGTDSTSGSKHCTGLGGRGWLAIEEIKLLVHGSNDLFGDFAETQFHQPIVNDVLLGMERLASSPQQLVVYDVKPEEEGFWEWRKFINGKWQRLPQYIAGVLEGALRSGVKYATVFVGSKTYNYHYLIADLENFSIAFAECRNPIRSVALARSHLSHFNLKDYEILGPWCKLTRFLRGRPSPTPDLRKPEDLIKELETNPQECQEISHAEAFNARTMAGKLVLSIVKADACTLVVQDILEQVSINVHKPLEQLSLVVEGQFLNPTDALRPL